MYHNTRLVDDDEREISARGSSSAYILAPREGPRSRKTLIKEAIDPSPRHSPLSSPVMSLVGSRPEISPVAPFHSPTRMPQSLCVSSVMSPTG